MKKIYLLLVVLNIISIFFLLQIVFDWFPTFDCDYTVDKIDKINNLVISLSIAIITSTLFYILLVYLPDKRKSHTTRTVIETQLRYLAENMQFMIIHLIKSHGLKTKNEDYNYSQIEPNEFSKIKINMLDNNHISGNYEIFVTTNDGLKSLGTETINLKDKTISLTKLIDNILSSPTIIFEDENLIRSLNAIKDCSFFKLLLAFNLRSSIKDIPYDPTQSLIDFYLLYNNLIKYTTPHNFHFKKSNKIIENDDILSNLGNLGNNIKKIKPQTPKINKSRTKKKKR